MGMAVYVTENDLIEEFGASEMAQLGSRDPNAIDSALRWAEGLVRGYLNAAGLDIPTPTPDDVRGVICDAVRWRLYDDALTEVVALRFQNAMDWLKAVAAGRVVPPWASDASNEGGMAYTMPASLFTRMPL